MIEHLSQSDPDLASLLKKELARQKSTLELIASENFVSIPVLEALGSWLTNRYSEGYPGKRYYGGNQFIDEIERLAIERAIKAFTPEKKEKSETAGAVALHANVQPYSGSPANLAAYLAFMQPGDTFLGMSLAHGGHLTHGHKVSATSKIFKSIQYGVRQSDELIDYDQVRQLAREHKPKVIVCGATAYPREIDFKAFAEIAREVGAIFMADIAHLAGLIVGGAYPNPFPYADVATTTTQKTLRGPRGAMILCKQEFAKQIDKSIFPGLQGGPHDHQTAAIAVCLGEALKPEFKDYAKQVIANARALAESLQNSGVRLVAGGTDCHMVLADLTPKGITGQQAETLLESVGITVNKNMIPFDTRKPLDPSGIRLGTPALTTRGMKEPEMESIGETIGYLLDDSHDVSRSEQAKELVAELTEEFPLYQEIDF